MADRFVAMTARSPALIAAATVALAAVVALTLGSVAAVALRADGPGNLTAADWAAVRFTVVQAVLSATLSTVLAVPVARALARRTFPGRSTLISLLGAPFILPVIVAILGLLAVFGRSGMVNQALSLVHIGPIDIFGLHGVVLAHVFFNLPLATRLLLQGWLAIPAERFRVAASLDLSPRATFRLLEIPLLRASLPGIFLVVFLICLTSFAVALTLGGGPRATTVELAIYQAFVFDFDLGRAARLALVQLALGTVGAAIAFAVVVPSAIGIGLDRAPERPDAPPGAALDVAILALSALFLLIPAGTVVASGIAQLPGLPTSVFAAALRSLFVAAGSVAVLAAIALPIALLASGLGKGGGAMVEGIGLLTIAASPLVVGTGLFLIVLPLANPTSIALPLTAVVNAAAALPFALRALVPACREASTAFGPLAESLSMPARTRLRLVILPRIRRPLAFSLGLGAALSMGDLGVIALFGSVDAPTLPLMMYRLMGAYRMDEAAGAAVLLVALSFALFLAIDRGGRPDAEV